MANTKLSAKRRLKMDTHIRRLLIIMVCWFVFMGIMKGRKFYSVVNFQTMFAQFPEFGLMSLGVMVCICLLYTSQQLLCPHRQRPDGGRLSGGLHRPDAEL